jgi:hypothetical protein
VPAQGSEQVALGDCVELAALPGEDGTRVVSVRALWTERLANGQSRMMARCQRYFRPQARAGNGGAARLPRGFQGPIKY